MYDYGMVKSIHDQRMRQFMIEAERAHLVRQLRKSRSSRSGIGEGLGKRLRVALEAVGASLSTKRLSV